MTSSDNQLATVSTLLRDGIVSARAGLRSVATAQFEKAILVDAQNAETWLWLAWSAASPDNMIRCLERVLELSPGHEAATAGLTWARRMAQDTPPLEATIDAAVELAPMITDNVSESRDAERFDETHEVVATTDKSFAVDQNSPVPVMEMKPAAEVTRFEPSPVVAELTPVLASNEEHTIEPEAQIPETSVPPMNSLPASSSEFTSDRVSSSFVTGYSEAETSSDVELLAHALKPLAHEMPSDGRPLVMVVDDSPTVRKLVSLTLERRGYRVVPAFDGVAAIEELGHCRPDLILLDINMPRLDGYRLCKLIKKHEATQNIPVVMLSGKDGMFDKLRGRLVGCADYITKPFEADSLSHKVAKYISTSA